jgi:hypothetical protein
MLMVMDGDGDDNDDGQNLQSATMIIHDLRYASPMWCP